MSKFLDLFKTRPPQKPLDLDNFERARENLHGKTKDMAEALDAFGDMVRDMRGLKPNKKRRSNTR